MKSQIFCFIHAQYFGREIDVMIKTDEVIYIIHSQYGP